MSVSSLLRSLAPSLARPLYFFLILCLGLLAACATDRPVVDAASKGDYKTVYEISHPKAMAGDDDAMIRLAVLYAKGHHVEQDMSEALKWAYVAADKGHFLGQSLYTDLLERATDEEIIESERRIKLWDEEH